MPGEGGLNEEERDAALPTLFVYTPEALARFAQVPRCCGAAEREMIDARVTEEQGFCSGQIFEGSKRHVRAHRPILYPSVASPARRPP